ncbi:MAG: type II secretion system protein GspI [Candidatus Dactylopiibacterium carminicum]|uniref:Type II secretion system protein I n=1 Tax=Candidatus Dactylopiibacterium carminicum TaxID=857335 RepID=A0A272ER25_9RHOO|nr:type II secretion system minor pseudopilin GspI [Candidatus Dactylopiibacterium carminicum]KAF7598704.1 type II secretion system protein GspI [Candidatus Dactylopiibacterium carminicum]PAS92522.1 MAG: type II secretion system protein GspI [Candidatus Dactylopiibacterium carminicum]PAS96318.1 MAG: type II secretion system protein GspI [Candidatus Dactylopiibacterium carminicum]PAS98571.1 MAG: type II secretion system protein GspI [Candidatus Dactylopiibacterium carminicum]
MQIRPERGFTLLETVIALAVISIALGAAIRAASFGADKAFELQQRTVAGWVASNVINQLLATRNFPEMGALDGTATQGEYQFIWRQETSATPNLSFRRVEVKVFAENGEDLYARQVSYIARAGN